MFLCGAVAYGNVFESDWKRAGDAVSPAKQAALMEAYGALRKLSMMNKRGMVSGLIFFDTVVKQFCCINLTYNYYLRFLLTSLIT